MAASRAVGGRERCSLLWASAMSISSAALTPSEMEGLACNRLRWESWIAKASLSRPESGTSEEAA
eukprot:2941894-Prorocentrum_lima.AAC.1